MVIRGMLQALLFCFSVVPAVALAGKPQASVSDSGPPLVNWRAPATYAPSPASSRIRALGDISNPVPFIAISPCRQYNSLLATPLLQAVNRTVTLTGAPCNIPASAVAVSVNITVFNITGATGNGVFKVDTVSPPAVAWINYPPAETQRANAGAVALTGGNIIVQVAQGAGQVDFIVDTNGYYGPTPATVGNPFTVSNTSGVAAIIGNNASPAGAVYGVWGHITANPAGGSSAGVRGENDGTGGGGIGVWGSQNGSGYGVYGSAPTGAGVFGFSNAYGVYGTSAGSGLSIAGVWGTSTNAIGTFGFSTNSNGMFAQSTNLDALAAFGGRNGGFLQGAENGVIGVSAATTGPRWGVLGQSMSTTGAPAGVRGVDSSNYLPSVGCCPAGVLGDSQTSFAVLGRSRYTGVVGYLFDNSDNPIAFGVLGTTFGIATDLTAGPWGVFSQGNFGVSGAKHFVEPHPTDPSRVIVYSSLEGPEVGTYVRGTARTEGGRATILLPDHFRTVTDEDGMTIQLTPVGGFASMYVESESLNQIVVRSSKDVKFHYLVQGVRRAFNDFEPVARGAEFMPRSSEERMPAYLTQEARRRLIANGTYNPDGTVNMATAERAGWTKIWADREAAIQTAAKEAQQKMNAEAARPK